MKCPYCDKEMELGYIQCRDGVSLANGAADNSRTVYAHRCSECRKVIINYADDTEQ